MAERKKRGSAIASAEKNSDLKGEQLSRVIQNSVQWIKAPPCVDDEDAERRLLDFFQACIDNQEFPTMEKLCLALGCCTSTFSNWGRGSLGPRRMALVKKARQIMASIDAEMVSTGHLDRVAYIFRAKNFYGMRDQQDVVVTPTTPQLDTSPEELSRKYLEATILSVDEQPLELSEGAERLEMYSDVKRDAEPMKTAQSATQGAETHITHG